MVCSTWGVAPALGCDGVCRRAPAVVGITGIGGLDSQLDRPSGRQAGLTIQRSGKPSYKVLLYSMRPETD